MLLVVMVMVGLAGVGKGLECGFQVGEYYEYTAAMDCMTVFSYNSSLAHHTVHNLLKAMSLYVFEGVAAHPPPPFSPPVLLSSQLPALLSRTYPSDFHFQQAIRSIFLQLHDAHTNYYAPAPMQLTFVFPLNFFSYSDPSTGMQVIEVANITNNFSNAYSGAQVTLIDGVDAVAYAKNFSLYSVGSSKDPNVRYNLAFLQRTPYMAFPTTWLGLLSWRPHHFALAPLSPTMSLELVFPNGTKTQLELPWTATPLQSWNSTEEYLASYWANSTTSTTGRKDLSPRHHSIRRRRSSRSITPIENATIDGLGFYQISPDTIVWYQNTFEPADYFAYYKTVAAGLIAAEMNGVSNLILDFSMNGGGDICLGRSMLKTLFPESKNFQPSDMPVNPLSMNLTKSAVKFNVSGTVWSPSFYQNSITGERYSNSDPSWLIPGIVRARGGTTQTFSQLVEIASELDNCGQPLFDFPNPPLFSPDRVVFISRGFCGSTCALFADSLAGYLNIRTAVFGGFSGEAFAYRSFPGLQVLESPDFYSQLDALYQNTSVEDPLSLAPRRLLHSGSFRFCDREVYSGISNTSNPLEYTQQNADFYFPLTRDLAVDPSQVWSLVEKALLLNSTIWN